MRMMMSETMNKTMNEAMNEAIIYDAIRTPIGRYGGALSSVRSDDLAAVPIAALMRRNPSVDWRRVDDVILGCANQAGEDNRNVARMAALLCGLPVCVPGSTVNRLCGSGMEAVGVAARAIKSGEAHLMIAGGVESMSRAPFVLPKAEAAFSGDARLYDTTLGWRFINPSLQRQYGTDSMPETAEKVAEKFAISRPDQDALALRSQQRAHAAQQNNYLAEEIVAVTLSAASKGASSKGTSKQARATMVVERDEHPRPQTTRAALAGLATPFKPNGTVTAGNASGINDGACALLIGSLQAGRQFDLRPAARIIATATVGLAPAIMGFGAALAMEKLLTHCHLEVNDMDVIEINEAFAAQVLAVTRHLGLADDAAHVNPNGGAIALGHPLGMSGARLVTTALRQLHRRRGRYALCALCIGVGQGIAMMIENMRA